MPCKILDILPLELWEQTLFYLDDPTDLWRCRQVCSQFSHSAARVFIADFLPKAELEILTQSPSSSSSIVLKFDRLSENRAVAIFRDGREQSTSSVKQCNKDCSFTPANKHISTETLFQSWGRRTPESPVHFIRIPYASTTLINDTPLPGFTINPTTHEVSFLWEEACDLFFRQDVFTRNYRLKFLSSTGNLQVYYCSRQVFILSQPWFARCFPSVLALTVRRSPPAHRLAGA